MQLKVRYLYSIIQVSLSKAALPTLTSNVKSEGEQIKDGDIFQ